MHTRWRIAILVVFFAGPFLILAGYGGYTLWERDLFFFAWWPMAGCLALGYLLAWYWHRRRLLLPPTDLDQPLHWTERDRQAWRLVEARAQGAPKLDAARLGAILFYLTTAEEMALELARFYHPRTSNPVGSLTIPEILAVVELAAHDLAQLVDQYLPAGHMLTVDHWGHAKKASDWYQTASSAYWLISALFAPVNTGMRYAATQLGMARPWQMLQQNLLLWFYTAYVHRLGTYLIEVNSGRLRIGATRYRELMQRGAGDGQAVAAGAAPADDVRQVSIAVIGQVKSGKSSAINALLGANRAQADVLPATSIITRYEFQPEGIPQKLILLDTIGYAHTGPREDQLQGTREAARQADIILLVLHARNPARQADLEMLGALRQWYAAQPDLKMPPILGVVTHIDLLTPALEWTPPYNWQQPERVKEQQIQQALTTVRDQLGEHLVGVVPVCAAEGKIYGFEEWCVPTLAELLDEAHAVALLRCLRAEVDAVKVLKVLHQLAAAGKEVLRRYRRGSCPGRRARR